MDAAMNRVAQDFGTRENLVILFFYTDEMFICRSKTDCVLNALHGEH